jgi:hypothetical protein
MLTATGKSTPSAKPEIEIAPGVWVSRERFELMPPSTPGDWILLDDAGYAQIGLKPAVFDTLRRLREMGVIVVASVAPRTHLLQRSSWMRHVAECAEDPWYWRNEKRLKAYRATYN